MGLSPLAFEICTPVLGLKLVTALSAFVHARRGHDSDARTDPCAPLPPPCSHRVSRPESRTLFPRTRKAEAAAAAAPTRTAAACRRPPLKGVGDSERPSLVPPPRWLSVGAFPGFPPVAEPPCLFCCTSSYVEWLLPRASPACSAGLPVPVSMSSHGPLCGAASARRCRSESGPAAARLPREPESAESPAGGRPPQRLEGGRSDGALGVRAKP